MLGNVQEYMEKKERERLEEEGKDADLWMADNLDESLGIINQRLHDRYEQHGQRTEDRLIDAYESRDTVDESTREAEQARSLMSAAEDRNRSRVGDTRSAPEQEQAERTRALDEVRATADARTNARVQDREFKDRTLNTLVNQGTNIRNAAQGGMGAAAGMQQQRQAANQQADEQTSGVGAAAGAGIGFAVGGPAGAMVGGSAGDMLEGLF